MTEGLFKRTGRLIKALVHDRTTVVLVLLSLFSLLLTATRVAYSGRRFLVFLVWNLFLAFLPWLLGLVMHLRESTHKVLTVVLVGIWLLFFPNAPYLLTDLVHLGKDNGVPVWYDLILLLTYGFTGMLYGFSSLAMIEVILRRSFRIRHTGPIALVLIYLSCFGIYLGRFLRWNSWDVVTNAANVALDIWQRVINPFDYPTTWIFVALLGTLLSLLYFAYRPAFKSPSQALHQEPPGQGS